jgi:predicted 2-oxoglutarate/Fe(II)-dependent dioxygenase YbiX
VGKRGADGVIRSIIDPEYRTASVLFSENIGAVCRKFDVKMNAVLKPLVQHLWGHNLTDHDGTQLVRYSPGGHYRAHSDVGRRTRNRYYTVLCYLNDDFEGGSTQFPALRYSVAPQSGKAILFPSSYLHCGEPVTSGEKYILVSWITGPILQDG